MNETPALADPSSLPAREDFRTALTRLVRTYALDVQAGVPAEEVARLMDEARMEFDEQQREESGAPCPESKMDDGSHSDELDGGCAWCGASAEELEAGSA